MWFFIVVSLVAGRIHASEIYEFSSPGGCTRVQQVVERQLTQLNTREDAFLVTGCVGSAHFRPKDKLG